VKSSFSNALIRLKRKKKEFHELLSCRSNYNCSFTFVIKDCVISGAFKFGVYIVYNYIFTKCANKLALRLLISDTAMTAEKKLKLPEIRKYQSI
jgi:hypothetical protein